MKTSSFVFLTALMLCTGAAFGQTYNYYFGNIHAHTSYSDGSKDSTTQHVLTPAQAYAFAKQSQHMDFLGISEHNHLSAGMHLASYTKGLQQATAANQNGKFVCMYGIEYGVINNGGHVVVYGFDKLIGWDRNNFDIQNAEFDYNHLFSLVAANPKAFATLAHPHEKDYANLINTAYNGTADQAIVGCAVENGPAMSSEADYRAKLTESYYPYFQRLLAKGYRVGPTIDHDNHYTTFGRVRSSRTVILAMALNRDSIMSAYHAGRFCASEDWNAKVAFTIDSHVMGSSFQATKNPTIAVSVTDPDATDKTASIKVMYGKPGSGQLGTVLKSVSNKENLSYAIPMNSGDSYYVYLLITQKDGDKIYTSPIWITRK